MAGSVNIRVHSMVNSSLNGSAKLSELMHYLENSAPEELADSTADAIEAYAAGTLHRGYGLRTGTLKESIEKQRVRRGKGFYQVRVHTTATRGEQRTEEYRMRAEEAAGAGPRSGVHARGRKFGGLPLVGMSGEDEGYATYVDHGDPNGRRPVPFMSHALGVGAVFIKREAAEAVRDRIRAAMSF